jgi:hypothetical protein
MAIGLVIYRQYGRARALTGEHGLSRSAAAAD